MKKLLLPVLMASTVTHAGELSQSFQEVQEKIAHEQIDNYLKSPSSDGIPGQFLETMVPKKPTEETVECTEEKLPEKKGQYEIVLVAQGSSSMSSEERKPGQERVLTTNDLRFVSNYVPFNVNSEGLNSKALTTRAKEVWDLGPIRKTPGEAFDLNSSLGRELYIDALVKAAGRITTSETLLAKDVAKVIAETFPSNEQKFLALSALSTRLYRNYNTSRNLGYNNPQNNPFGALIPEGDLSMGALFSAASRYDIYGGGVCNDIAEAVAMVGEHLFPDRDVLTVNSGSHFGVLITDGKTTRVIDEVNNLELRNRLVLDPRLSPTNLRISKVIDGRQKEIAVVDTEMGQVMEFAFQTGKNLLKTDVDVTTIMAHLKKDGFGASVGAGNLTDSQVVVVVAKYEYVGDKWKSYIGLGASGQTMKPVIEDRYQIHFRAGAERNIVRFVNENADVSFATGVRLAGMYAPRNPVVNNGGTGLNDVSGAFDLYNRVDIKLGAHNPQGLQLRSSVEIEHTLGPTNWGNTTGILSHMSPSDIGPLLRNTSFHLNQINADLTLERPLKRDIKLIGNTHYQGSNIGQRVSILAGLNIKVPDGAQLLVFTGYTKADIPGLKTQHSLLGTPSGGQVGVRYTTKSGVEIGGAVRSISGQRPQVNKSIKVPIK